MKFIRPKLKSDPIVAVGKLTLNNRELLTRDEFEKQASNVEKVTVRVRNPAADILVDKIRKLDPNLRVSILIAEYPYKEMISGECTVDDLLDQRINPHVSSNSFITVYYGYDNVN